MQSFIWTFVILYAKSGIFCEKSSERKIMRWNKLDACNILYVLNGFKDTLLSKITSCNVYDQKKKIKTKII